MMTMMMTIKMLHPVLNKVYCTKKLKFN